MVKFTDEQVSRILTLHTAKLLKRGGLDSQDDRCCVMQASLGTSAVFQNSPAESYDLICAFDTSYDENWSVDELLSWLSNQEAL